MTEEPSGLNDLLIAQVVGLIRATAEQVAQGDVDRCLELEAYLLRFIGDNCAAKGEVLAEFAKGRESTDD